MAANYNMNFRPNRFKGAILLMSMLAVYFSGCKTAAPNTQQPEQNGEVLIRMQRTACYGRCPIYDITIYKNRLLIYNAKQFTDTTGCFFRQLTKQQVNDIQAAFFTANFFDMADKYPEEKAALTDLPSCIIFYNNGKRQKTVTERHVDTPPALKQLEQQIDDLIATKNLQNCNK